MRLRQRERERERLERLLEPQHMGEVDNRVLPVSHPLALGGSSSELKRGREGERERGREGDRVDGG